MNKRLRLQLGALSDHHLFAMLIPHIEQLAPHWPGSCQEFLKVQREERQALQAASGEAQLQRMNLAALLGLLSAQHHFKEPGAGRSEGCCGVSRNQGSGSFFFDKGHQLRVQFPF
ncbi:unnamed protein product [Effrenium voratum]|nr:unnamed protein product [Effrenium voratum]